LSEQERSHRDISCTDQIGMESIVTMLTDKEQSLLRAILLTNMPTHRTRLTAIVGIDFDGHTGVQRGFVGNHALQLGKAPLGVDSIRFPLLPACLFALPALCPFTNMGQVFQAD
jgi:hypothetical protein